MKSGAAIAAIAALALIAGTAVAGKKLQTVSETVSVAEDQTLSVTARCAKGTKALSGGFETEWNGQSPPRLDVNRSGSSGKRKWTSQAFNSTTVAGDLSSFVYCRKADKVARVTDTVPSPVGLSVTATAQCPPGTRVISGGFAGSPTDAVEPTPVLYISESRRATKRTWEVSAFGNGSEPAELTAIAACAKGPKLKERSDSALVGSDIGAEESAELLARCKRKERVVSGGFGSPDGSEDSTPQVMTSKKQGRRGWAETVKQGGTGLNTEAVAYAYCEKTKKKK
jgi:hypothetical protein